MIALIQELRRVIRPSAACPSIRHRPSVVDHDLAGAGGSVSPAQAPCGPELAGGRDLHRRRRPVQVPVRAVDRIGATIDFVLRAHRDLAAARRFFEQAIELLGVPETITIVKSGANKAAIESLRADSCADIGLRQSKCLNNIVEQDHRAIKRIVRPMLGFKSFRCASILHGGRCLRRSAVTLA